MYRQCTTEKTTLQQTQFKNTLYELMQGKAYADISITELCEKTGLSRNIFYRLFNCKEDVLCALIDTIFYSCSQSMHSESIEENLLTFFQFWKEQAPLLSLVERNGLSSVFAYRGTVCCLQHDFGIHKYIHSNWNAYNAEIISFYVNGFLGIIFRWFHSDFSRTPEEMVLITLSLLNHPPIYTF